MSNDIDPLDDEHWEVAGPDALDYVEMPPVASHDDVDPIAEFDQRREEDIVLLRKSRGYFLITVLDNADGEGATGYLLRVRGTISDIEVEKLCVVATESAIKTMQGLREDETLRAGEQLGDEVDRFLADSTDDTGDDEMDPRSDDDEGHGTDAA